MITQERLKEVIKYNPETGIFTWNVNHKRVIKGSVAGHKYSTGYIRISIDGVQYRAQRLAWLYMTGRMPENQIDHINRVRDDNRFVNLRDVPHFVNQMNKGSYPDMSKKNRGLRGVCKVKNCKNRWAARVMFQNKSINIGCFGSPEEAHEAYCKKIIEIHGEYFHHDNDIK
ncbi:HNH endonuclease [Salmonella enterica subsp. enterica serovar Rubislaw]|nr:HNH endonuclease [Salmonella enterica subsp. enterica serovar Rubislaw]